MFLVFPKCEEEIPVISTGSTREDVKFSIFKVLVNFG